MWRLLRQIADAETHDDVLRAVVLSAFQLRSIDLDATVEVVRRVTTRAPRTEEPDSAIEACVEAAGIAWVQTELAGGSDMLTQPLLALLHEVRSARLLSTDDEAVRQRALALCDQFASIGLDRMADLNEVGPSPDPDTVARLRSGAQLLRGVAMQLYFASGAFDARQSDAVAEPAPEGVRLFREARPLITRLAPAPLAPATHYLVETLEYVLAAEPELVLLSLREIVTLGGHAGGYQDETLAIDAIVRILERYLANHRGILQRPEYLAALHELLDVFIDAGWPQAHRLVYSLDEIFR
jgi:hypothetical protein